MNRASLLANVPLVLKYIAGEAKADKHGQQGLFGAPQIEELTLLELPEMSDDEKLWYERKALGTFVSAHPLDRYRHKLGRVTHTCREIDDMLAADTSTRMVVAGLIGALRPMGWATSFELDDGTGRVSVLAFSDQADRYAHLMAADMLVALQVKVRHSGDRVSLQMLQAHGLGRFGPFSRS